MESDPGDPDLESIAADLADAEQALQRLSDGTYWTDEVTGEPLSDAVVEEHPTTRRAVYVPFGAPVTAPHGIPRVEPAEQATVAEVAETDEAADVADVADAASDAEDLEDIEDADHENLDADDADDADADDSDDNDDDFDDSDASDDHAP